MGNLLRQYGVAVVLAGLALFIRGVLPFPEGTAIYQLPIAAVVLSAWYGGRGPGLLASLICITGASYFFVPPVHSFLTAPEHVLPLSIFVVLCLLLTEFSAGRRGTEQALRTSEERFRMLVRFSFDVYWETDAQHRFTRQEYSQGLARAPAPGSEIGKTRWEVPYLEPDEEVWREHRALLDAHLPFSDFELARPSADGGKRHVSVSGMPVFDQSGQFAGYRGVGRDITERKRVQDKLRESEARFRTFVDQATDAFFLLDEKLNVVDVNRQACESLGWSREELIGMHPHEFDVGLDASSIAQFAARAAAGEIITVETRHRRKDGAAFSVEVRCGTFRQEGTLFYLALVRDITERQRAQETLREKDNALQVARTELARVSRLTTLGELTTSIVHEVSQPMGAMMASAAAGARWLAAEPPDIAEARSALDNIAADGKRAREVIARIRALTKRQVQQMELLDVNRKIHEVLALTEHELRSHEIAVQAELDTTLPHVAGDRIQLQQVLLNLIMNAMEAMSRVDDRTRELTIVSGPDGPDTVVVEVRDSGTGLTPEAAERVFEAFYTTKAEGIGIGLSISRSIVEAHGGRLWADSNDPHGAVFRFSLPVAESGQAILQATQP